MDLLFFYCTLTFLLEYSLAIHDRTFNYLPIVFFRPDYLTYYPKIIIITRLIKVNNGLKFKWTLDWSWVLGLVWINHTLSGFVGLSLYKLHLFFIDTTYTSSSSHWVIVTRWIDCKVYIRGKMIKCLSFLNFELWKFSIFFKFMK